MADWAFRPLARTDFPLLATWLRLPHVARWWADDPTALEAGYGGAIDGIEPAEVFVGYRDRDAVGLVQRYALDAQPRYLQQLVRLLAVAPGAWSIDYLVAQPGRGIGTEMLGTFVARLWRERPDAACLLAPVHQDNQASRRVLEHVGFTRAASGELAPDNPSDSRAHFVYRLDRPAP